MGQTWVKVNQFTLTKSADWPLEKTRYTVWVPVTVPMLAGTVCQLCQPPVEAMEKLPTGVAVGLSRATSTRPLIPAAAPEATRA